MCEDMHLHVGHACVRRGMERGTTTNQTGARCGNRYRVCFMFKFIHLFHHCLWCYPSHFSFTHQRASTILLIGRTRYCLLRRAALAFAPVHRDAESRPRRPRARAARPTHAPAMSNDQCWRFEYHIQGEGGSWPAVCQALGTKAWKGAGAGARFPASRKLRPQSSVSVQEA